MINATKKHKQIPIKWKEINLGSLFAENPKSKIKVGDAYSGGTYPFFTSGESVQSRDDYLVEGENIFLATGGVANAKYYNGYASYSSDTYCISSEHFNTKLLFYYLRKDLRYINYHFFEGSGLKHLKKEEFKGHSIVIPIEKCEQEKIVEVLYSIDENLKNTKKLIDKYTRIKKGLMKDLFYYGVNELGEIRNEKNHKFKNTVLGRMPSEWQIVTLEQIYSEPIRDFGSFSSTKIIDFLPEGVLFIKSEMIEEGALKLENKFFISAKVHKLLNKSIVKRGNILFSKIGSALGKALVYDGSWGECNSNAAVAKISVNDAVADKFYITYLLNYKETQSRLKNLIVSLLPRINLTDISNFLIKLPSKNEQVYIAKTLSKIDDLIEKEEEIYKKFFNIKLGLMDDLLTGIVRTSYKK